MTPRFLERMQRQHEAVSKAFCLPPQADPPPYEYALSRTTSMTSSAASSSSSLNEAPPSYQRYAQHYTGVIHPSIPRGSLILVIGAGGWLGSHIVDQLINCGYTVRGAVRTDNKALLLAKIFGEKYGPYAYSSVVVPDMTVPGAYNTAAKHCSGIVHTASVTTFSSDPYEVIPATVMGALNALEAASREPEIRRFVYCSSVTAAAQHNIGKQANIDSHSWNMAAFKTAWESPPYDMDRAWSVFASSKLQAEQAVWKWYREKRPAFVLNTVLPDMLFGQSVSHELPTAGVSMHIFKEILANRSREVAWTPPCHFTDVEDAALVHIAALVMPGVMNERLFATAHPWSIETLAARLRDLHPDRHIDGIADTAAETKNTYVETSRAEELLRRMGRKGFADFDTILIQASAGLVQS